MRKVTQIKGLLIIGIVVLAPLLLGSVDYLSYRETTCLYDAIGMRCFGCDGLRAWLLLKQGKILESLKTNILVIIGVGVCSILLVNEFYCDLRRYLDKTYKRDSILNQLIKHMFKGIDFKEG